MTRLTLFLAALAAFLLWPAVALAQTADTPPAELVSMLLASWGQWSVVAGLVVLVLVQVWRKVRPEVWDQLHPIAKRLVPPTVAALTTGAVGLAAGGTWEQALQVFAVQWIGLAWAADVLTGVAGKGKKPGETATSKKAANAKPKNPPISGMSALLFLIALGVTSCTAWRPVADQGAAIVNAACELGLVRSPAVRADAEERMVAPEWLASALCALPDAYDAWIEAQNQRAADPGAAAVEAAARLGL